MTTVVLTGVLTDICVLHTAIDAYNLSYDIEVVASATSFLDAWALDFAIGHLRMYLEQQLWSNKNYNPESGNLSYSRFFI